MRNEPEVELMQHHDPPDGGVLLRLNHKPSGVLSERNERRRGIAAKNKARQVVNSRTEEKEIV